MKKILLVAQFNEQAKEINKALTSYFQVQLCSADNRRVIKSMVDMFGPDLILISLSDLTPGHSGVFKTIANDCPTIPVTTIGSEKEKKPFDEFYDTPQFCHVNTPLDEKEILQVACDGTNTYFNTGVKPGRANGKHLLFVDDNAVLLRHMKNMMEADYRVSVATSGAQALALIAKDPPDLIFLDYEMPICDGKTTLGMLRAEEDFKDIPVVFLTGLSERQYIESILSLNPQGYLLKPTTKVMLAKTIQKILGV